MRKWPIQEAENRLGDVADAAIAGEPQELTRRGKPAVVVIAATDYERPCSLEESRSRPFNEYLLTIPQDDGEFDRLPMPARPFEPTGVTVIDPSAMTH